MVGGIDRQFVQKIRVVLNSVEASKTAAAPFECLDLLALSKKAELLFDDGVSHHILRVVQR